MSVHGYRLTNRSFSSRGASWLSGGVCDLQARDGGFDPRLVELCSDVVFLGKALCSHVHPLDPGVSGSTVKACVFE